MNTYIINCVGLGFDIAGAWFIAIEVVYQYKGEKYLSRKETIVRHKNHPHQGGRVFHPEETDKYKSWEESKYKKMWTGLILLTIGFSLQISSNLIIYFYDGRPDDKVINTQITTNDTVNIEPPAIVEDEVKESSVSISIKPDVHN